MNEIKQIKESFKLWMNRLFDLNSECTHVQYRRVDLISRMTLFAIFLPIIIIEILFVENLDTKVAKLITIMTAMLFVLLYYLATFANEVRRFKFRDKSPTIYGIAVLFSIVVIFTLFTIHLTVSLNVTPMLIIFVMLLSIITTFRNSYKTKQDEVYFNQK